MKKFILFAALVAAAVFVSGYSTTQLTVVTRTHTVISGDTLWDIAWRYMPQQDGTRDVHELIYNIRRANGMERQALIAPGQVLIIPLEVEAK